MNLLPWKGRLLLYFLAVSLVFNLLHYVFFQDIEYIFKFILAQLGFLPISVYLVTIIINQLLGRREKQAMLKKLNMVIGSFFSEVGTDLLRFFVRGEAADSAACKLMRPDASWQSSDYMQAKKRLQEADLKLDAKSLDWHNLSNFLHAKRDFLLGLLGNPNLLEHESFSELLWAVFHLAEELGSRDDLTALPDSDYEHLLGDVMRAYLLIVTEWLDYMEHLQEDYPFLFSLAVRTNPCTPDVQVEIGA